MVQDPGIGAPGVVVRRCHSLAEYERCVVLERAVWGEEITVPTPIFVVAEESGGQVLGAFEGGRMIGFTLALPGVHGTTPYLHSHMTAVLPEFQNRGIGWLLKMAQRDDALGRGIGLVEWTFDPLELRNAYFNLVKLGAVVRRFLPNFYGITGSPLHGGLPTDRLVAEWWLGPKRVDRAIAGVAEGSARAAGADTVRVAVPSDIGDWKTQEHERALRVQGEVREQFQRLFAQGYVGNSLERGGNSTHYVLESPTSQASRVEE